MSSPAFRGPRKAENTRDSPIVTRQRTRCKQDGGQVSRKDGDDDPDTPSKAGGASGVGGTANRGKGKGRGKAGEGKKNDSSSKGRGRQQHYCTQECLVGIVRRSSLDENCPNVSLHRKHGRRHAINQQEFLDLVQKQLAEDLDHNCEPLGLQGARGALFKVTLVSHGYVLVGKGTVQAFVPDLRHEGDVYRRLAKLQGVVVPVCLGNINLTEWYYLDVGVRILHMLLMSWGGELADEDESVKGWQGLQREIRRTVAEVRRAGVDQSDERPPNILWNRERKRAMLIDFERAKYIRGVLQEISPNKKRKRAGSQKRAGRTSRFSSKIVYGSGI